MQSAYALVWGSSKCIKPPQALEYNIKAEIARCVKIFNMSLGWFDCTEPSLSTSLKGMQVVQAAYARDWACSSASNLLEPHIIAKYVDFFHICSGWFDCTELSLTKVEATQHYS